MCECVCVHKHRMRVENGMRDTSPSGSSSYFKMRTQTPTLARQQQPQKRSSKRLKGRMRCDKKGFTGASFSHAIAYFRPIYLCKVRCIFVTVRAHAASISGFRDLCVCGSCVYGDPWWSLDIFIRNLCSARFLGKAAAAMPMVRMGPYVWLGFRIYQRDRPRWFVCGRRTHLMSCINSGGIYHTDYLYVILWAEKSTETAGTNVMRIGWEGLTKKRW